MGGNQRKYTRSAQHCVGSKRLKKVDSCSPSAHRGVACVSFPRRARGCALGAYRDTAHPWGSGKRVECMLGCRSYGCFHRGTALVGTAGLGSNRVSVHAPSAALGSHLKSLSTTWLVVPTTLAG